jgi:hypothetical protein
MRGSGEQPERHTAVDRSGRDDPAATTEDRPIRRLATVMTCEPEPDGSDRHHSTPALVASHIRDESTVDDGNRPKTVNNCVLGAQKSSRQRRMPRRSISER